MEGPRGVERETEKASVGSGGLSMVLMKLSFRPPGCRGPLPKPGEAPAIWSVSFFLKRASQIAKASGTHRSTALGTLQGDEPQGLGWGVGVSRVSPWGARQWEEVAVLVLLETTQLPDVQGICPAPLGWRRRLTEHARSSRLRENPEPSSPPSDKPVQAPLIVWDHPPLPTIWGI